MNTKPQQHHDYLIKWATFPPEKLGIRQTFIGCAGGQSGKWGRRCGAMNRAGAGVRLRLHSHGGE
jgi:hypothetical protein